METRRWRAGGVAPLVAGGGDLAKLKSLLYGRIGRGGYTGWIPTGFSKTPGTGANCVSRSILFFSAATDKREPSSKLGRGFPRLDRTDFWEILDHQPLRSFPDGKHAPLSAVVIVPRLNSAPARKTYGRIKNWLFRDCKLRILYFIISSRHVKLGQDDSAVRPNMIVSGRKRRERGNELISRCCPSRATSRIDRSTRRGTRARNEKKSIRTN